MIERKGLCFALIALIFLLIIGTGEFKSVEACYGPHITADINATEVNLNEAVIVTGQVCPAKQNLSIRVTFARPDYTWIDNWVLTDNVTGKFSVTQKLDMVGYWNIFPIYGHLCDRLYANVTDPTDPLAPLPTPELPPYKPNVTLVAVAGIFLGVGVVAVATGRKNKTRNISSLRLHVRSDG